MNYAFMTSSCPELNLDETLHLAKTYGYDGIEIRIDSKHHHGVELNTSANQRHIFQEKFRVAETTLCCIATSCRFADPATAESAIQNAIQAIHLAADLHCERIRVFGGIIGQGLSRPMAIEQVSNAIHRLIPASEKNEVRICIETHDDWCEPQDVAQLLNMIDHPLVGTTWDLMHPVMTAGKSIDEAFTILRPWIYHVHVHDGYWDQDNRIISPIGQGIVDHKRALELLDQNGYDGYLSGEWIRWRAHEDHLPQELRTLKAYERELKEPAALPSRNM